MDKTRVFHAGIVPFGLFLIVIGWTGFFAITLLKGGESFSFLAMIGAACMGAGLLYFVGLSANTSKAREMDSYKNADVQEAMIPVKDIVTIANGLQQSQASSTGLLGVNVGDSLRNSYTAQKEINPAATQEAVHQVRRGRVMIVGPQLSRVSSVGGNEADATSNVEPLQTTHMTQNGNNSAVVREAMSQVRRGTTMIEDSRRSRVSTGVGNKADAKAVIEILGKMHMKEKETNPVIAPKTARQIRSETVILEDSSQSHTSSTEGMKTKGLLDMFIHGEIDLGLDDQP